MKLEHSNTRSIIRLYERGRLGELWLEEIMAYTTGDKRVFRRGDFSTQIQVHAGHNDPRYTDATQMEAGTYHMLDIPFCTYTLDENTLHRSGIWPDLDVKIVDPFTVCHGCEGAKPRTSCNEEFSDLYNGVCGDDAHDKFFKLWNQLGRNWFTVTPCADHSNQNICACISEYHTSMHAYLTRCAVKNFPEFRGHYMTWGEIVTNSRCDVRPWHVAASDYYKSKRQSIYRYYEAKQKAEELAAKAAKKSAKRAQKTVRPQTVEFFQMSNALATIANHENNTTTNAR